MLKLYNYYRSSASFRVRIALHFKNISYTDIPIHLVNNHGEQFSPEYQKINPQCLVPTLLDDEKIITQSLAIIEYINEKYPEPSLLPTDCYQKALARSFALEIAADLHPLNNLRVLKYLTQEMGLSEDKKMQWYRHWIATGLEALEKRLTISNHAGKYCIGNTFSIADLCLVPQMYNARRFECDLNPYPILTRIDTHCQTLSAVSKAWPQEN